MTAPDEGDVTSSGRSGGRPQTDTPGPAECLDEAPNRSTARSLRRMLVPKDRPWWISFVLLFLLGGLWSLASPVLSVPDEGAHVMKAAAVVRGQLLTEEVTTPLGPQSSVVVPEVFTRMYGSPCYAFKPDVSVACAGPLEGKSEDAVGITSSGRYPPLYYMAVGAPSLAFESARGVRLMRLVSVGLSAALLASAFASARQASRSHFVVVGLAVAITPMVLYLSGSVNPNGFEIAAAAGLWASLLALLLGPASPLWPRTITRAAAAALALALSRPLSPVWVVLIGLLVLAMADRERVLALLRNRLVRLAAVVSALSVLAGVVWVMVSGALNVLIPVTTGAEQSFSGIARRSLGGTGNEVLHMIGVFGWLDTMSALATYYAWFTCIGFLLLAGLASAGRRHKVVVWVLVILIVLLPRVIEASQVRTFGFAWQGRYTLPLAVGLPMVTALLAGNLDLRLSKELTRLLVGAVVIGHALAFMWAYRRFAVGVSGPLSPLDWPGSTRAMSLLVVFTLVAAAYGWWVVRLAAPDRDPVLLQAGPDDGG